MSERVWVVPYFADYRSTVYSSDRPAQWTYYVVANPDTGSTLTRTIYALNDFHRLSSTWPPPPWYTR